MNKAKSILVGVFVCAVAFGALSCVAVADDPIETHEHETHEQMVSRYEDRLESVLRSFVRKSIRSGDAASFLTRNELDKLKAYFRTYIALPRDVQGKMPVFDLDAALGISGFTERLGKIKRRPDIQSADRAIKGIFISAYHYSDPVLRPEYYKASRDKFEVEDGIDRVTHLADEASALNRRLDEAGINGSDLDALDSLDGKMRNDVLDGSLLARIDAALKSVEDLKAQATTTPEQKAELQKAVERLKPAREQLIANNWRLDAHRPLNDALKSLEYCKTDKSENNPNDRLKAATRSAYCNQGVYDGFESVQRLVSDVKDINEFMLLEDLSKQAFLDTAKTFIATQYQYNPELKDKEIIVKMLKELCAKCNTKFAAELMSQGEGYIETLHKSNIPRKNRNQITNELNQKISEFNNMIEGTRFHYLHNCIHPDDARNYETMRREFIAFASKTPGQLLLTEQMGLALYGSMSPARGGNEHFFSSDTFGIPRQKPTCNSGQIKKDGDLSRMGGNNSVYPPIRMVSPEFTEAAIKEASGEMAKQAGELVSNSDQIGEVRPELTAPEIREKLKELVAAVPAAVGKVLLGQPGYAANFCAIIKSMAEDEANRKTRKAIWKWGGIVVGTGAALTALVAGGPVSWTVLGLSALNTAATGALAVEAAFDMSRASAAFDSQYQSLFSGTGDVKTAQMAEAARKEYYEAAKTLAKKSASFGVKLAGIYALAAKVQLSRELASHGQTAASHMDALKKAAKQLRALGNLSENQLARLQALTEAAQKGAGAKRAIELLTEGQVIKNQQGFIRGYEALVDVLSGNAAADPATTAEGFQKAFEVFIKIWVGG